MGDKKKTRERFWEAVFGRDGGYCSTCRKLHNRKTKAVDTHRYAASEELS